MLLYNLRIALEEPPAQPDPRGADRGGIALGIAVSTTLRHRAPRVRQGPDPGQERRPSLRAARQLGPAAGLPRRPSGRAPRRRSPTATDGAHALATSRSGRPGCSRRTGYVFPDPKVGRPTREDVRLCLRRLLPDVRRAVPLRLGRGTAKADREPEPVVVLGEDDQRAAVRRAQQRRPDAADRGPRLPRGRRARRLAADRASSTT